MEPLTAPFAAVAGSALLFAVLAVIAIRLEPMPVNQDFAGFRVAREQQ